MECQWVVMPGIEYPGKASFDRNAVCETEAEADAEAKRRTAIERENGNLGTVWFVTQWWPDLFKEVR